MEQLEFKENRILRQIALGIALLMVIVIVSVITSYFTNIANENVVKALLIEKDFNTYFTSLKTAETGQRGYLLTLDSIYLDDYNKGVANFRNTSIKLENSRILTDSEKKYIRIINDLANSKLIELNKTIVMASGYQLEEALDIVDSDRGKNIMDSIAQKFDIIRENENERIINTTAKAERYRVISNFITFFGIIIILFIAYSVIMQIKPMVIELIKNKETLQNHVNTLSTKNTQLENFAYIASHDLKEPLRTVSNFVDLLEEEGALAKLNEDERLYFNFIHKAVERMNNLINGLLTYSKLGQSSNFEQLDLNKVLISAKENLAASLEAAKAQIICDPLPVVTGLEIELIQLFQNIISNALKFRKKDEKCFIKITHSDDANFWKFSIKDNGIGIPENKLKDIFKFMTKLHREDEYAGYGLGLAFCEKVINLHHGTIWVESKINDSSTFHFTVSKNLI